MQGFAYVNSNCIVGQLCSAAPAVNPCVRRSKDGISQNETLRANARCKLHQNAINHHANRRIIS
jgi:hypothetical protein